MERKGLGVVFAVRESMVVVVEKTLSCFGKATRLWCILYYDLWSVDWVGLRRERERHIFLFATQINKYLTQNSYIPYYLSAKTVK